MKTKEMLFASAVRIHKLTVMVDESRAWAEAVRATGPDTRDEYLIWKAGDKYPARNGATRAKQEIVLANFGNYKLNEDDVLIWGREQGYAPAPPRPCFAVGEQHTQLHINLEVPVLALVSPDPCLFQGEQRFCVVWWDRIKREVCLFPAYGFWGPSCWFAFIPVTEGKMLVKNRELTEYAGVLQ